MPAVRCRSWLEQDQLHVSGIPLCRFGCGRSYVRSVLGQKSDTLLVSAIRTVIALYLAAACAAPSLAGAQQPYPVKPIRALVGFPPGGATDILARQLAQKLSESFGQQVIVDNRAGGGGIIAAVMAREAPPDGYTLFFGTISTLAANVATNPKLPYDPLRDYAPITLTASNPYFLVVHPWYPQNRPPSSSHSPRPGPASSILAPRAPAAVRTSRWSIFAARRGSRWCTYLTKGRRHR